MEKYSIKYKDFVYESLEDKFKDTISDDYASFKRGLLIILEKSVKNPEELVNVQNFINNYIENPKDSTLIDMVEDGQIFDIYMKYQADIDELCAAHNFFDKSAKENNVFSLYAFVIEGTKFATLECFKLLEKDLFKK